MSNILASAFIYIWFFILVLFLFRPFQLTGIKRKLFLVCLITYSLDTIYRVSLQAAGLAHSYISNHLRIPLRAFFLSNQCLQVYVLTKYLCPRSQKKTALFFWFLSCHPWGVLNYISSIHQRKFKWEAFNCNLFSSPWSCSKSSLSYLCSKVV